MDMIEYLAEQFEAANPFDFKKHLLGLYTVGSRGYNLHTPESDYDLIAVVRTPTEFIYGLGQWDGWHPKRDTLEHDLDIKVFSLDKFIRLLLKSNPNVLEVLWFGADSHIVHGPVMEELRQERFMFNSKRVYEAMTGMARGMRHQMESYIDLSFHPTRDLGEKRKGWIKEFGYNPKDAYRMLHAFYMAREFMRSGQLLVRLEGEMRDTLLQVKNAEWSREDVLEYADALEKSARVEYEHSTMPAEPRRDLAERFLMRVQEDFILQEAMRKRTFGCLVQSGDFFEREI